MAFKLKNLATKLYLGENNWTSDPLPLTSLLQFEPEITNERGAMFSGVPRGRCFLDSETRSNPLRVGPHDANSARRYAGAGVRPDLSTKDVSWRSPSPVRDTGGPTTLGLMPSSIPVDLRELFVFDSDSQTN